MIIGAGPAGLFAGYLLALDGYRGGKILTCVENPGRVILILEWDSVQAHRQHRGPIYGQLLAITRDPAAAEDLCQEAFLRLTGEARAGRMPDNIGAWLHRVAANLATSRGRRSRTADRWSSRLVQDDLQRSPEDEIIRRERSGALRAALSEMNRTDRTAVLLAAYG